MRSFFILFLILVMSACASATFIRDSNGQIMKIKTRGNINATAEKEGEKVTADSKYTDLFKGLVSNNKL